MAQLIGDAHFNTQVSMGGGAHKLLNPLLTYVVRETMLGYNLYDELNKLMFQPKTVYSYDEKFSTLGEVGDLQKIPESGIAPDLHISKGKEKGYQFITWGGKLTFTRLVADWIRASHNLEKLDAADSTGKKALREVKENGTYLSDAAIRKLLQQASLIYLKGFQATSVNGPGGTGEDGEPLFSIHHPYKDGTEEYANCGMEVGGNIVHPELTKESLLHAIQMLKGVKKGRLQGPVKQNGMKIPNTEGIFDLIVPVDLEAKAGEILNVSSQWIASALAGEKGENSNKNNVFSWEGYKVRIVPMTIFGWTDENGEPVGTGKEWFVRNNSVIRQTKSLQMANLNGGQFGVKTWDDPNTDNYNIKTVGDYAFEFGRAASLGLWGSKGDNSQIN